MFVIPVKVYSCTLFYTLFSTLWCTLFYTLFSTLFCSLVIAGNPY